MNFKCKRLWSAGAALLVGATVAPLLGAPAAFANGTLQGAATVKTAGGAANFVSGNSATTFTLRLPAGAACPGDSPNDGWRWQTYMVPTSVDPSTLTFDNTGPAPNGVGASFRQPLYDTTGTPVIAQQTPAASPAPGPGLILNIPDMNLSVFTPGQIPAGAYNVGIACTLGPPSATQMSNFWNTLVTISTDTTAGGPAQVDIANGARPAAPVLNAVTAGDSQLTAAFTPSATDSPADTGFTVTATPQPSGTPVTHAGTASPITVTGLTDGTTYSVTVHATNSVGNGPESNAMTGTPSAPGVTNLAANAGTTQGSEVLTWTAPTGAAPTGYQVSYALTGGGTITGSPAPASPFTVTATTATISSLDPAAYTATVVPLHGTGANGAPASVSFSILSAQSLVQNVTVTRPTGAIVLTQVCGSFGALPADTSASIGFPNGSLPAVSAVTGGTAPTTTAGGSTSDPVFAGYPYPTNPDGTPNATYPTYCALNLGNAQFIKTGPGAGQFFAASGRMNQVTVVDTRDTDIGWNLVGTMSRFVKTTDSTKSFSGSELGWDPVKTSTTPSFTDSDGNVYTQTATPGAQIEPNTPSANGLGTGKTLGTAAALACSGTGPTNCTGGLGIGVFDARLKLLIPVTAVSGTYAGTLTFSVV